jgi:hypothetical protein
VNYLAAENLIHKSEVYFNFITQKETGSKDQEQSEPDGMQPGDIYIYLNQICLYENGHWFRANIGDIKGIETLVPLRQIIIYFSDYELVITCNDYSQLAALRDYLYLSRNYLLSKRIMTAGLRARKTN